MKKLSVILALAVAASALPATITASATGEYGTVSMIWNEEFNDPERTEWNDAHGFTFQANRGLAITPNSDGTATFTCTAGAYVYSKDYQGTYGSGVEKYVVEAKVSEVTGRSDLLIGTEREMFTQIDSAGVYYTVVDRNSGSESVDFYDNAGVKTSQTGTLNFGDKRLFHMYMSSNRTVSFDYIRVYTIDAATTVTVDSATASGVNIITSAPIDASTAVFTATNGGTTLTSTGVSVISMSDNQYFVSFSGLTEGVTYTLGKTTLNTLDGTAVTSSVSGSFTVPAPTYELYFNDYDSVSASDYTTAQADHAFAANDGILSFTSTTTWKAFRLNFTPAVTDGDFVTEIKIASKGTGKFQMGPTVDSANVMNGSDINSTGVFYGVIDKANGTYKLFDSSLTLVDTQSIDTGYSTIPGWAFSSGAKSLDFDYLAAYKIPATFGFEILSSSRTGAQIKTTEPLTAASTFTVSDGYDDVSATIAKSASGYNTYDLTFASELDYNTEYTLTPDSVSGVNGAIVSAASDTFTTPAYVPPTYHDVVPFFVEDANSSNTYTTHYGQGTFDISRANGEVLIQETGGAKEVAVNTPITPPSSKFYVEYEQTEYALHKNFNVYPGGYSGSYPASSCRNKNGKFYGVLDSTAGTYTVYYTDKSGTCTYLGEATGSGIPSRLDINPGAGALARLNYLVAYDYEEMITQLGEADVQGIRFKTTAPINTSSSTATYGGIAMVLRPVTGEYLSYIATFPTAEEISVPSSGTLSLALKYLDGSNGASVSYSVTMPAEAGFYANGTWKDPETDEVTGTVIYYNNTDSPFTFYNILAVFDGNRFVEEKHETYTIQPGKFGKFVSSRSFEYTDGYTYKNFVWENMTNIKPLCTTK